MILSRRARSPIDRGRPTAGVSVGFRFRKSLKIAKGIRLNFSKRGTSVSLGGPGATINLSKEGIRSTVGVPGTGLSFSESSRFGRVAPGSSPPTRQYGAGEMNLFLLIAFVSLLVFGWGHAWAFFLFLPVILFFAWGVNADLFQRQVPGFPACRVRTPLPKTLDKATRERVRDLLGVRSQIVAGPFSAEQRIRVIDLDHQLEIMLPSELLKDSTEVEETPNATVPMFSDRGILIALALCAVLSLYGFGSCVRGVLREGAAGIVNDEYARCETLHRTNAMSDAEYGECLAAVQKLEDRQGTR